MATISKSGITDGGVIDSTHITRIIDALDGTGSADIYATGSFTGSFIGDGSQLTGIVGGGGTPGGSDTQIQYNNSNAFGGVPTLTYDGSVLRATGSFSGSFKGNGSELSGIIATSASYAATASYVNTLRQDVTINGSFSTSGSVYGHYRSVSANCPSSGPGIELSEQDYIIYLVVPALGVGTKNHIILPNPWPGQIIIIQTRFMGSSLTISVFDDLLINDAASVSVPAVDYTQLICIATTTGWLTKPI